MDIEARNDQKAIRGMTRSISQMEAKNAEIFKAIIDNLQQVNDNKAAIMTELKTMHGELSSAVASIDQEESELIMEGDVLDPVKSNLRTEFKDFISFWNGKLINIQDLFLQADTKQYHNRNKDLDAMLKLKQNNIEPLVVSINDALEDSPELLNQSPYADGWIIEIKPEDPSQFEDIMDRESYLKMLKGA